MASSKIYLDALAQFRDEAGSQYRDGKDQELLREFWKERSTPEETSLAAQNLRADAGKKYGSRKIGDTEIPDKWISNIMGNINNFVQVGNYAMKGAPESVGLAWFAVKLTLSAIQNNYDLYSFFGSGLTDITEIMIIIPHYDRLYDERSKADWKASPVLDKMFKDIKSTYAAVLHFSFSIKRHLTAGTLTRIRHGFKDFFGTSKGKFEAKINEIAVLKKKILEGSEAAFQDKSLRGLEAVQTTMTSIQGVVNDIRGFQGTLEEMHKAQMGQLDLLLKKVDEFKATNKPRTPWELAVQEFERNKDALSPLKETGEALETALDERFPNTCTWLFDDYRYSEWVDSRTSSMLCLTGQQGTGKSILLASVFERLGFQDTEAETILVSFSCGANSITTGMAAETVSGICNTLLYQLYELASQGEHNIRLLKACNDVFLSSKSTNPKTSKASAAMAKAHKDTNSNLPEFADAFVKLAVLLKRKVVIILDAVDALSPQDQVELAGKLQDLVAPEHLPDESDIQIRVLVGCRSATKFYTEISSVESTSAYIDVGAENQGDMGLKLVATLQELPGIPPADRDTAKQKILDKAGPRFSYINDIAIPFICQPFQGPISEHLEGLPGGMSDAYQEELRKMAPNYVDLLRTALTWSLLAPVPATVEEVMEAFHGVYKQPVQVNGTAVHSTESHEDGDGDDEGFAEASHLEVQQLRDASGPFLEVSFNKDSQKHYVYLQDPLQIEAFCFESGESGHQDHIDEAATCVRCKSSLSNFGSLSMSKKDSHLDMAITLLRHLNNPLFQKRAGLLGVPLPEKEEPEKPKDGEGEAESAQVSAEADENATKTDPAAEGATEEKDGDGEASGEDKPAADDGYDSDDSLDDEDRVDENTENEDENEGNEDQYGLPSFLTRGRYEIQFWPYHIREAEKQWSAEERASSSKWALLMEELDRFATGNLAIFHAWEKAYTGESWLADFPEPRKPLYVAAALGLTSWAKHLLDQGADPNSVCGGRSTLHSSAGEAVRLDMLKLLLERGADINFQGEVGTTAFFLWTFYDPSVETIQLMLDHGADASIIDGNGLSILHCFMEKGKDPKALDLLLDYGPPERRPDINVLNSYTQTPLHSLLWRKEVPEALVHAALDRGADVDIDDQWSIRPLQMASSWGELHILKIIRPRAKEVDDLDHDGDSALHQAAICDHKECVRYLAETGADPNLPNHAGRTALHDASWRGFKENMEVLLEQGGEVHPLDKHDRSPFFYACLGDAKDAASYLLDLLLERKVPLSEINKPTKRRRTRLRQAAEHGFDDLLEKLIKLAETENDVPSLWIDEKDTKKGMTPLHRAVWRGQLGCVRLLLDAKADVKIQDAMERTALTLAYEQWALVGHQSSYEDIISLLIDSDPDAATRDAELVAMCAVNGSTRLLEQLRALGTDLNRPDRFGWTPLNLAKEFKRPVAEEFLKRQATWASKLPSKWAANPSTTVSEDGVTVTHTSGKMCCISTDKPLPAGIAQYYFEVTSKTPVDVSEPQPKHPVTAIGFCTIGGSAIQFPGWPARANAPSAKSWGYHGDDGYTFVSENEEDRTGAGPKGVEYGPGDTVGCGVDLASRTMWFTRNGVKLEPGFTNVQGRLFPLLGLWSNTVELETNFTGPFKWKEGNEKGGEAAVAEVQPEPEAGKEPETAEAAPAPVTLVIQSKTMVQSVESVEIATESVGAQ